MAVQEKGRIDSSAQQVLGFVREVSSPERLDAGKILEDGVQLYLRKLQANHVGLDKRCGERLEIQGFPGELQQLFSNLILNATESMQQGGRLRLRVVRTH